MRWTHDPLTSPSCFLTCFETASKERQVQRVRGRGPDRELTLAEAMQAFLVAKAGARAAGAWLRDEAVRGQGRRAPPRPAEGTPVTPPLELLCGRSSPQWRAGRHPFGHEAGGESASTDGRHDAIAQATPRTSPRTWTNRARSATAQRSGTSATSRRTPGLAAIASLGQNCKVADGVLIGSNATVQNNGSLPVARDVLPDSLSAPGHGLKDCRERPGPDQLTGQE